VGITPHPEPSKVSGFFFLPLTSFSGGVARVGDQTIMSLD
jgi:hypothetical protein